MYSPSPIESPPEPVAVLVPSPGELNQDDIDKLYTDEGVPAE